MSLDLAEYKQVLADFRKAHKGALTNHSLYNGLWALDYEESSDKHTLVTDNVVLMSFLSTDGIYWLYFTTADENDLKAVCDEFISPLHKRAPVKSIVHDKGSRIESFVPLMESIHFKLLSRGQRFDCTRRFKKRFILEISHPIEYALPSDIPEIRKILLAEFDPLTYTVLSEESLRREIEQKRLIVIRIDGRIVAVQQFSHHGKYLSGGSSVVLKEYRNEHLYLDIAEFLRRYMQDNDLTNCFSWVSIDNKSLLKGKVASGDVPHDLFEYVFVYER
jgi:hypothetical protein